MAIFRRRKPTTPPAAPPDDFTVAEIHAIRAALQIAIVHHTKHNAWPAAEIAQQALAKIPRP